MSEIDTAIQRLQDIVLSSSDITVRAAPDYPVEDANVLPLSIAYIASGQSMADDFGITRMVLMLKVDVHFSRVSIVEAYKQINRFVPELLKRLAGDPTLGGSVDTIVYPITFEVLPMQYNAVVTQAVSVSVPVKIRTGSL